MNKYSLQYRTAHAVLSFANAMNKKVILTILYMYGIIFLKRRENQ